MATTFEIETRRAKCQDFIRALGKKRPRTHVKSIRYERLSCFVDGVVEFTGSLNAIVGGNGVGKSTLIGAVLELLAGKSESGTSHSLRMAGSITSAVFQVNDLVVECATHTESDGGRIVEPLLEVDFAWLDSASIQRALDQVLRDQNFEDVVQAAPALEFSEADLRALSFLVGKTYTAGSGIEIDDFDRYGMEPFPFFRVTVGGVSYDSRSMGMGELSLFNLFWALKRAPEDSILLIEEPETHVSPRSQSALVEVLAQFCVKRSLFVIITTHSPTIVRKIPPANVALLAHFNGTSMLIKDAKRSQIEEILGEAISLKGAFFVEDEGAKALLQSFFAAFAPESLWNYEVAVAPGGASQLEKMMEVLPPNKPWLKVRVVFDGDQRSIIASGDMTHERFYLPGDLDPDYQCVQLLQGSEAAVRLSGALGVTISTATLALNHLAGRDPHDWPTGLSAFFQKDIKEVRQGLARLWLEHGVLKQDAQELVQSLLRSVGD